VMDVIKDEFTRLSGSKWHRSVTYRINGHKVRAVVDADSSYPQQSRIYADVWSPTALQWNRVQTLAGEDYPMPSKYVRDFENRAKLASWPPLVELDEYVQEILS
jgi:hypothetical protein